MTRPSDSYDRFLTSRRAARALPAGLLTSPKLVALLPKDGPLDFSMLAFQDVGGALGLLASALGAAQGSAASELSGSGASLACRFSTSWNGE